MRSWQWPAWGTSATLIVADDAAMGAARRLVTRALTQAEHCADLHNPRSEVGKLASAAGRPRKVSSLLAAFLRVGLAHARATNGLFDPTVGAAVIRAGQDHDLPRKDFFLLPSCGGLRIPAQRQAAPKVPGWYLIELEHRTVQMPPGTLLDLTALGRAATARYCADLVWNRLGVGVLVDLGGDSAAAGPTPAQGWPVITGYGPNGQDHRPRDWRGSASMSGPVIDPSTGRPAPRTWKSIEITPNGPVSGLVEAKALAITAAVLGPTAPELLARKEVTALLESPDGTVLRIGGNHGSTTLVNHETAAT